jgi:hypothetical protein
VVYTTAGPKLPLLKVSLGGCEAEPALALLNVGGLSPTLSAELVTNEVWLSWNDAAYHLQATPALSSSAVWTNFGGSTPRNVSFGPGPMFFRLANP